MLLTPIPVSLAASEAARSKAKVAGFGEIWVLKILEILILKRFQGFLASIFSFHLRIICEENCELIFNPLLSSGCAPTN